MYTRKVSTGILSLVHFNFPHYYALNSGLKDEIPGNSWYIAGNAAFAGKYQPVDVVISNAPKFGYRCLYTQSNSDYIFSRGLTGTIDGTLCAEIFINIQSSTAGNILAVSNGGDEIFSLSVTASRNVKFSSNNWNITATSDNALSLNSWHHIRLAVSNRTVTVYADGVQIISADAPVESVTFTMIRIGGANALYDEFILRDNIPAFTVTSQPYNLALDMTKMGGFGTGRDGEFTADSGNVSVNTCGHVSAVNGKNFTVHSWAYANHKPVKEINAGDEVMFLVLQKSSGPDELCGLYAFRNIISVDGKNFSVDAPVNDEFDMAEAVNNYLVYCYKIPHFAKADISADLYTNHYVAAFRCSGDVNFTGGTHMNATGGHIGRNDSHNLTHSDLPDRMIPSAGNIIITCGGKFTAPEGARLGHEKAGSIFRPAGYGGRVINGDNCIMIPYSPSTTAYGFNILIAAKRSAVDESALAYGARATNWYSGLCYLAGDLA